MQTKGFFHSTKNKEKSFLQERQKAFLTNGQWTIII